MLIPNPPFFTVGEMGSAEARSWTFLPHPYHTITTIDP